MIVFERPDGFKVVAVLGLTNVGGKTPDNLDFLAEEGSGVYQASDHIFGPLAANVMQGVSLETMNLGLLYFDDFRYSRDKLVSALNLLGIQDGSKYSIFSLRTTDRGQGFITQARFVSDFAMKYYFNIKDEEEVAKQPIGMVDAIISFIESEIHNFGSEANLCKHFGIEIPFDGSFGLGFGFLVENSYYNIYRIWSRPVFYSK